MFSIKININEIENSREKNDFCTVKTEYNETKDVMFWNDAETMARMELTAGSYAIYLPDVAHKPGIAVSAPEKVKKCVGKVRV